MSRTPDTFEVRRVKVALEAGGNGTRSLGPALAIAARLRAAVHGLLVEEPNLARLAHDTAARYVSRLPSEVVTGTPDLQAELRAAVSMMQTALAADAARLGLPWSLQVIRGLFERTSADVLDPHDLLVAAANSRLLGTLAAECATITALASALPCSFMILPGGVLPQRPLVFAAPQPEPTQRALSAAIQLADTSEREIDVALVGHEADETRADSIRNWLAQRGYRARFAPSVQAGPAPLVRMASAPGHTLFVLPAALAELEALGLPELCRRIRAPLLIVQ
jgi:hypothetical protein